MIKTTASSQIKYMNKNVQQYIYTQKLKELIKWCTNKALNDAQIASSKCQQIPDRCRTEPEHH